MLIPYSILSVRVPPLDELYSELDDINEIRWIVSFDDVTIAAIRQLPKKFLLISTTLYALVKVAPKLIFIPYSILISVCKLMVSIFLFSYS